MLLLVAACALIDADGRILMAQRPDGKAWPGKWEFPGGKLEQGERAEAAIIRELREEIGIEPCERCLEPFNFISTEMDRGFLLMTLFLCRQWDGFARPQEGQNLRWLFPSQILDLDLVPADVPLARELRDRLPDGQRFVVR